MLWLYQPICALALLSRFSRIEPPIHKPPIQEIKKPPICFISSYDGNIGYARALTGSVHNLREAKEHAELRLYSNQRLDEAELEEIDGWSQVRVEHVLADSPALRLHFVSEALSSHPAVFILNQPFIIDPEPEEYKRVSIWQRSEHYNPLLNRSRDRLFDLTARGPCLIGLVNGQVALQVYTDKRLVDTKLQQIRLGKEMPMECLQVDVSSLLGPFNEQSRCRIMTDPQAIQRFILEHPRNILPEGSVVLGVPVTSRGYERVEDLPLVTALLSSLSKTVSSEELRSHPIIIYVGYDRGDLLYSSKQAEIQAMTSFPIRFFELPRWHRVAQLWNLLYGLAVWDGASYFYQLNDDVTLETTGWLGAFTAALDAQGGFGVVGPADPHNGLACVVLTQAMVTRRHAEVFDGLLYPEGFADWKSDRWLTHVYGEEWGRCMKDFVARNGAAGRRYQQCEQPTWELDLEQGRSQVGEYLSTAGRI